MTLELISRVAGTRKPVLLIILVLPFQMSAASRPGTAGTPPGENRYGQLVQQGKRAEAAGNWDEALAKYQEALKISPGSNLIENDLAAIYFKRKNFEESLHYCERALAANPRDPVAAKQAGMAAYQLNRFAVAKKYLLSAVAARPADPQLHYWLGMTFYSLRDARHALDEFYRAHLYDPKDTEVLYMIGEIHWEMCRQAWQEMVRINPNSVRVKQMVAEQDARQNLYPEAIAKYQEIIKERPDEPGFRDALGKVYLHVENFDAAETAFEAELSLDPSSPLAYYGLAQVAFERRNLPAALENATQAVKKRPDFGDAYVLLGRIDWNMGNREKAMAVLEHAVTLSPADPSLFYVLANAYRELGKRELAAKALATYKQLMDEQETQIRVAR